MEEAAAARRSWDDIGVAVRRMSPVRSVGRLLLALSLTLAPAAMITERPAFAEAREIAVGTELQATSDVTLHRAEIAKGSKVAVTRVLKRAGRVDGVSVALADGHVVKMTLAQVRAFFRVVD